MIESASFVLREIMSDPDTWSQWCRTGGGVAGERLLQLVQAMIAVVAAQPLEQPALTPPTWALDDSFQVQEKVFRMTPCCVAIIAAIKLLYDVQIG